MVTKRIDITEKTITLQELLSETTEPTEIILMRGDEQIGQLVYTPQPTPPQKRVLGLHKGQGWISDDFMDELPD
ncbi:MAG: toxin-antitoxin (TA) system antitoxin [Chloroflexota bacterium]